MRPPMKTRDEMKLESIKQHEKENLIGSEYYSKFGGELILFKVVDFDYSTGTYVIESEYKNRQFTQSANNSNASLYWENIEGNIETSKKQYRQEYLDKQWITEFFGFKAAPSAYKTLNKVWRFDKGTMTKKEYLIEMISDGWNKIYSNSNDEIFLQKEGDRISYELATATEYLFAQYVIDNLSKVLDIIDSW